MRVRGTKPSPAGGRPHLANGRGRERGMGATFCCNRWGTPQEAGQTGQTGDGQGLVARRLLTAMPGVLGPCANLASRAHTTTIAPGVAGADADVGHAGDAEELLEVPCDELGAVVGDDPGLGARELLAGPLDDHLRDERVVLVGPAVAVAPVVELAAGQAQPRRSPASGTARRVTGSSVLPDQYRM